MTSDDRTWRRIGRRNKHHAPCGTHAAYVLHLYWGQRPHLEDYEAHAAYMRQYRAAQKQRKA